MKRLISAAGAIAVAATLAMTAPASADDTSCDDTDAGEHRDISWGD